MAETTQEAPATTEAPAEEQQQTEPQEKSATDDLGEAGKKALESERRSRRAAEKRASETEARLKEFEDRDKSEAEKQTERLTAAERRAQEAETSLARFQVALDKGLTPNQAKRLVGSTREELEADADELLKDLGEANKPRSPRPDPTQGKQSTQPLDPRSADLAQIEADLAASRRH